MADTKRDESSDIGVLLIDEESKSDEIGTFVEDAEWWEHLSEMEQVGRIHYVPISDLEAAQARIRELENACRVLLDFCHTAPGRLPERVTSLESLLAKEPHG